MGGRNVDVSSFQPKKKETPTVGLEPTTTRLRALRSTNGARRARMVKGKMEVYLYLTGLLAINYSPTNGSFLCNIQEFAGVSLVQHEGNFLLIYS